MASVDIQLEPLAPDGHLVPPHRPVPHDVATNDDVRKGPVIALAAWPEGKFPVPEGPESHTGRILRPYVLAYVQS